MADLIGAGSASLGGLSATAAGQTRFWGPVTPTAPANAGTTHGVSELLTMLVGSWDGVADVRLQVATSSTFASPLVDTVLLSQPADGATAVTYDATGLLDGTTYYWRATAGEPGAGTFGAWTATQSFTVVILDGAAMEYAYCNVGVQSLPNGDAAEYAETNVGVFAPPADDGIEYIYCNVGLLRIVDSDAVDYVFENVTTTTPTPAIWFLKPTSGRAGDGIDIYGWGFGDLQTTYTGIVEVDFGDGLGWVAVPAVSWQTFPADANAYTADRILDPVFGEVSWQHTVIGILVPADAIPPGYPVRVRTNGP